MVKPGKFPSGKTEIPFEFPLHGKGNRVLYETYHGVFVNIQVSVPSSCSTALLPPPGAGQPRDGTPALAAATSVQTLRPVPTRPRGTRFALTVFCQEARRAHAFESSVALRLPGLCGRADTVKGALTVG